MQQPSLTAIGAGKHLDPTKDPRGLVGADLMYLRQVFKPKPITPKSTMAEIQYDAGVQAVLNFIEDKMIAKRN